MGESGGFLARWSRRKRDDDSSLEAALEEAIAAAAARGAHPADPATPTPPEPLAVNPAALPPVESITAASDIRAFLAPGVPAELAQAALRRAWGTDPEVRDFVENAQSQQNSADSSALPGTLDPNDDVGRLVDRLVGEESSDAAAVKPPADKA